MRDRIYRLRGPVRVRAGGTLEIEAGTLVEARGAAARIEVDPGGRLFARGTERAPVVLTCEEPGCWGGLAARGPSRRGADVRARGVRRGRAARGGSAAGGSGREFRCRRTPARGTGSSSAGAAGCFYCAASEAGGPGWSGARLDGDQHVYVQQGARGWQGRAMPPVRRGLARGRCCPTRPSSGPADRVRPACGCDPARP